MTNVGPPAIDLLKPSNNKIKADQCCRLHYVSVVSQSHKERIILVVDPGTASRYCARSNHHVHNAQISQTTHMYTVFEFF
jgi:hypothetical protein